MNEKPNNETEEREIAAHSWLVMTEAQAKRRQCPFTFSAPSSGGSTFHCLASTCMFWRPRPGAAGVGGCVVTQALVSAAHSLMGVASALTELEDCYRDACAARRWPLPGADSPPSEETK